MASDITTASDGSSADPGPLAALRKVAGYRNAKDFAALLGVPTSTYSRWERGARGPESRIPLRYAWRIADLFGCTIDAVVGRVDAPAPGERDISARYRALSESGRARLDEYVLFLEFRDRMIAPDGR